MERVDTMQDRPDAEAKAAKAPKDSKAKADAKTAAKKADDQSMPLATIPKTLPEQEAKARTDLAKSYRRGSRGSGPGKLDAARDPSTR